MHQKQLILGMAALTLLFHNSLCSWGKARTNSTPNFIQEGDFPFSQDQQWAVEESYLLWKPYMGNMWYGNKAKLDSSDTSNTRTRVRIKNPEFDWSSGVRLGFSRYLPHHDSWDINLTPTFFYSDTHDTTHANPNNNVFFNDSFALTDFSNGNKGTFAWRLNYWTVDFCAGRLFQMTPRSVFHPYFGLRGSWQYQKGFYKASRSVQTNVTQTVKGKLFNDFWGVGPRFGTHFIYYFENHFSFLSNFAVSLLVGNQKLENNNRITTAIVGAPSTFQAVRSHDSMSVIRSNIEGMVGMGWEKWLQDHTIRIAPSVAFEGSLWFAMNQIYNRFNAVFGTNKVEQRRNGNLGLMGVSFNLQVDF